MRVTNNMLINNMIGYINQNLGRLSKYQNQVATGKKISVPSDDPIIAARALKLRTDVSEIEQFKRNTEDAISWLEITEDTVKSIGDVLQRARELAVDASNGTKTPSDLEKIKAEIEQLREQLIHLSNTTYAGRYIFSGFSTNKPLINEDGTFAIDVKNIDEQIIFQIGIGDDINVNVPGGDLFNRGADATAGEVPALIKLFDDYINALASGDNEQVSSLLGEFDKEHDNILRVRADVGARANRLELRMDRIQNDVISFTKLMSLNEDADMAEVFIKLKNEENVYRASLAGGARIIMPTLLDFLR